MDPKIYPYVNGKTSKFVSVPGLVSVDFSIDTERTEGGLKKARESLSVFQKKIVAGERITQGKLVGLSTSGLALPVSSVIAVDLACSLREYRLKVEAILGKRWVPVWEMRWKTLARTTLMTANQAMRAAYERCENDSLVSSWVVGEGRFDLASRIKDAYDREPHFVYSKPFSLADWANEKRTRRQRLHARVCLWWFNLVYYLSYFFLLLREGSRL